MPSSILNLKFKGNKSFVAFSNLNDVESLTKTWKVCTKVAHHLDQGQRLENLSWRLWHLQSLMVDTDNARSKREFRKLSKVMSERLDKEKGRPLQDLPVPAFTRNASTDMIQQRAAQKERERNEIESNGGQGLRRMQFTFEVDRQPVGGDSGEKVGMPDMKPSAEFGRRRGAHANGNNGNAGNGNSGNGGGTAGRDEREEMIRFPSLFSNDFGPSALLNPQPSVTASFNYGEGASSTAGAEAFSIVRPTIEVPLDELLDMDMDMDMEDYSGFGYMDAMQTVPISHLPSSQISAASSTTATSTSSDDSDDEDVQTTLSSVYSAVSPLKISPTARSTTPRPTLSVRTTPYPLSNASLRTSARPSATATTRLTPTSNNSAPGGVKAECSNCGATHTPLWRRGLNDELNCNACGLYCKLHKRPRPKSMRNNHGEGRAQSNPRPEAVDVMAQCYNCHTTATPLWRKDDEGKTVCNACGLYYKLHGSARPISMKSDVIRKRSRHDARRMSINTTASPGVSRRASPDSVSSSISQHNPLSSSQHEQPQYHDPYDYAEDQELQSNQSELMGALGGQYTSSSTYGSSGGFTFPGPYHPSFLTSSLPLSSLSSLSSSLSSSSDHEDEEIKSPKRRRMSSASEISEPPSSTYSSSSSHSSQMDFPFSNFPNLSYLGANAFWAGHPPMVPSSSNSSPHLNGWGNTVHPPMLPQSGSGEENGYMQYPQANSAEEENMFFTYLHPPMSIPEGERY